MMRVTLSTLMEGWRGQLAGHARLRLGLAAIVAILWVYGLLLAGEHATLMRADLQNARAELRRLEAAGRERDWPARADDARRHLAAMQGLVWTENDLGLAEAALQDWLRATATKAGLGVRELAVVRAAADGVRAPVAPAAASALSGPQVLKARLVADFNRIALLGLLDELQRHERAIVVDHLVLRTWAQPPTLELDLRVLAQAQPRSGAAK